MDKFDIEIPVYLLSQIVDIHINEVGSRIKMSIPYFLRYLHTADYFLRILNHIDQQIVFLRGKPDADVVSGDFLPFQIDGQIGVSNLFRRSTA